MKEKHYSALWILMPVCGVLVVFTGGMLFRGWFARDFDLIRHAPILIGAFVVSILIAMAVIGGYIGVRCRKIDPRGLKLALGGVTFLAFVGATIACVIDGFSGEVRSFVVAIPVGLLALYFGAFLIRLLRARN